MHYLYSLKERDFFYIQACKLSCLALMMDNRCGCVMLMVKYDNQTVCKSDNSSVGKLVF